MDEQAAGAVGLGIVVLTMAAYLGMALVYRTWLGPLSVGLGVGLIATLTVAAMSEARRR